MPGDRNERDDPADQREHDGGRRDPARPSTALEPRDGGLQPDRDDDRDEDEREDVPDADEDRDERGRGDELQQRRPADLKRQPVTLSHKAWLMSVQGMDRPTSQPAKPTRRGRR